MKLEKYLVSMPKRIIRKQHRFDDIGVEIFVGLPHIAATI